MLLAQALPTLAAPLYSAKQLASSGAGKVPPLTFFFVVNKVFPELKEVSIFMTREALAENENKVNRAAATFNLKATIYLIESSTMIGQAIKQIPSNSLLVILSSGLLSQKSSILYILSKCKEKQILLITSSQEYSEAGALLGLVIDENQKTKLVVNLTHYENLRPKFSQELLQQQGIFADIQ